MTVTIHPEILDGDLQGTRPGQRKTPGSKGPAENSGTPPARHRGANVRGEPEQQWGLGHRDNRDLTPGRASDPRKPMGRPLPPTGHQNARYRVAYHTHSGGTTLNITTRRVGSVVLGALAIFVIIAGKGALLAAGTAVAAPPTFPYPHMSVQTAQEANSPTGTLFVTVDDGTARPASARARAVPTDGTLSRDAAYSDPANCERIHGHQGVCWRYWQVTGDDIRVWTTYQQRSCVLIGSVAGEKTRILCDGITVPA